MVARRSFIQQLIYTIIALVFGPEALAALDLVATEQLIDDVLSPPWTSAWAHAAQVSDLHAVIMGFLAGSVYHHV